MNIIHSIIENITADYSNDAVSTGVILSVLLAVFLLSAYEMLIYRFVSRRSFYNRSLVITVTALPFFISTITLCLQSNLVITLGTIGALAIIRYRTSVKDPVDMLYILWAVHTGIICGCRLYEIGVLTSLAVTVVLFLLEYLNIGKKPYILVLNSKGDPEEEIIAVLKEFTNSYTIKSRIYNGENTDLAIEISLKDPHAAGEKLRKLDFLDRFSIIQYDSEEIL